MAPYTIRLFMWGFQGHFQSSAKFHANEVFGELDPSIEASVFLLGLLRAEAPQEDNYPVCIEPEECGFSPNEFASIRQDAAHRKALDPESLVMCTDPRHHQSYQNRVHRKSEEGAVLAVLDDKAIEGAEFFFSGFIPVGKYDVGIVLCLTRKGGMPYELPKVYSEERYGQYSSLLNAVIREFFSDCLSALDVRDPEDVAEVRERPVADLFRAAGSRFMESPVWATGVWEGLYGLYGACNAISSLRYEGDEGAGRMIVTRDDHPNITRSISLAEPVRLSRPRAVRKLLEIANDEEVLLCDGVRITGFGAIKGDYDQGQADLFEIDFVSHYTWELRHANHRLMRVSYDNPALPPDPLDAAKLASDLERIFPESSDGERARLIELALAACKQSHGTLVIVSESAAEEAQRLGGQCTRLEPTKLIPSQITRLGAIDGAILLNPNGDCHAIGAILDGLATKGGDPSRGARYNSAIRYISDKDKTLALIVSEDGMIEWVPNLMPRIRRQDLEEAAAEVHALLQGETFQNDRTIKVLTWLRNHEFYLSSDLCEAGNNLYDRLYAERRREGLMIVVHGPLKPSEEMSQEYLID